MSAPLLFVAADPREFAGWVSRWSDVKRVALAVNWARTGKWKGQPVAAVANGAGADRAFAAVILAGDISAVCNVGFCGALDEKLAVGDVVVGTGVRDEKRSYEASIPVASTSQYGVVASIGHVAQTAAEKKALRSTGASVVEMEAAGVARASEDLDVPFYCVRAVSDLATEDLANDFNAALTPEGEFSVARLIRGAMGSPRRRFGELLRLRQRTALASKNLGTFLPTVASNMRAAVYRGHSTVSVDEVETPVIGDGEILIRVEACGVCHTDLKKIEYDLLTPPRIYGHETAGVVARTGRNVRKFKTGDRVIVFHHIPCGDCFYCARKLYAQCPVYKKVGVTAGFEPAGGGFSQYVRVMDWIVERGVEKIPDGVPFEVASFVEPVNTCVKAVAQCDPQPGDVVMVQGQGPIGLIFTMLLKLRGCVIVTTDTIPLRLDLSRQCGATFALDPRIEDVSAKLRELTDGRGADMVFVATNVKGLVEEAVRSSRPGAKIMLFAQTSDKERIELSGASVCVGERSLLGSYSASVDLQKESADLVFSGKLPVHLLISHRVPLDKIEFAFRLATHPGEFPGENPLKIIVRPQESSV